MLDDLVFLALVVCWLAVSAVAMEWWHQARSEWLSRLSARGLLTGRYSPAPARYWGTDALRWMFGQRVTLSDLGSMRRLQREADTDRVTEVWRVRMIRRQRVLFVVGLGGLATVALAWIIYNVAGELGFLVVAAAVAVVGSFRLRLTYRRIREWGDSST